MKLQFNVPDDLFEFYVKKYGLPKTYQRMRKILEEMKDVDESDRYIILSGDNRRAIEAVFQKTIGTPEELAKLTNRLNVVRIGGADIHFTVDELERIDMQARFHNKSREDFIQQMALELKDMMLDKV